MLLLGKVCRNTISSDPRWLFPTELKNAEARVLTGIHKRDHITSVLASFHWLPILLLTYKAPRGLAPSYLGELVTHVKVLVPHPTAHGLLCFGMQPVHLAVWTFLSTCDLHRWSFFSVFREQAATIWDQNEMKLDQIEPWNHASSESAPLMSLSWAG